MANSRGSHSTEERYARLATDQTPRTLKDKGEFEASFVLQEVLKAKEQIMFCSHQSLPVPDGAIGAIQHPKSIL